MSKEITSAEVAAYWDGNADTWAEHVRQGRDAYRELFNNPAFLEFVGDLRGRRVLDAGCGEGHNTRLLARGGATMTGVDISSRMIQLAREEEARAPLGIRYEATSYTDLSTFDAAAFDAVVSFMALMDGPDFRGAAREIYRVLRPGGDLAFSITHPCYHTAGLGWIRDAEGNSLKLTVANYFAQEPQLTYWRFKGVPPDEASPFAVPRFPRTLSEYVNALIEAGFVLRRLSEPRPTAEACAGRPWLQRWRDHAALVLYVRASKPA